MDVLLNFTKSFRWTIPFSNKYDTMMLKNTDRWHQKSLLTNFFLWWLLVQSWGELPSDLASIIGQHILHFLSCSLSCPGFSSVVFQVNNSVHNTVSTIKCPQYSVHTTVSTLQCPHWSVHYKVSILQCPHYSVHTKQCPHYNVHTTMFTLQCSQYSVHYEVSTLQCPL